MTISAIITTFNRASIVPRAIDSVLTQTLPVDELLVVDDGSTDNTREVVARYGPPVRYIYQQNQGLSASRNTGVRAARGEWVAFLDDDDEWLPVKVERQVAALRAAPGAAMCYGGLLWQHPNGSTVFAPPVAPGQLWPGARLRSSICPCSMMVRKSIFTRLGGFNERLRCCEDWEFGIRLAYEHQCVAVEDEPVVKIYDEPNSMSKNGEAMLQTELSILDTLLIGLRGPARWIWRHRVLSSMYYRAAVSARVRGLPCLRHIVRSLLYWPSPGLMPHRFGTLLLEVSKNFATSGTLDQFPPGPGQNSLRQY